MPLEPIQPNCTTCGQYLQVRNPFLLGGVGNFKNPSIVIVGINPYDQEDEKGEIILDEFLAEVIEPFKEGIVYINCVKCACVKIKDKILGGWPQGYRKPTDGEVDLCKPLMIAQLSSIFNKCGDKLPVIITLGDSAVYAITGHRNQKITERVGKEEIVDIAGKKIRVIPEFHPSYFGHNPGKKPQFKARFNQIFSTVRPQVSEPEFYDVITPDQFFSLAHKLLDNADNIPNIVLDVETTSKIAWEADLLGFVINADPFDPKSYYVPIITKDFTDWVVTPQEAEKIKYYLGRLIKRFPLIGHNIKYDLVVCIMQGIVKKEDIRIEDDTMFLANYLYNRTLGNLELGTICISLLQVPKWKTIEEYLETNFRLVKDRHFGNVPTRMLGEYACRDGRYTRLVHQKMSAMMQPQMQHLREIFNRATPKFADAEAKGIKVDKNMHNFLDMNYIRLIDDHFNEFRKFPEVIAFNNDLLAESKGKVEFSSTSGDQMKKLLFKDLNKGKYFRFPVTKWGKPHKKTGIKAPSADADILDDLAVMAVVKKMGDSHVGIIDVYQKDKKIRHLKSTYIDSITEKLDQFDIYRTSYNLTGTITGRLSSGFHLMPKKSDIKKMYVSRWVNEGGVFISADESQLELRIMASLALEEVWIDAFAKGYDLHTATAAAIYKVPLDQVTKEQRNVGKTMNFAMVYGKSVQGIADDLKITVAEAQSVYNNLFSGLVNLARWIEFQHKWVRDNKFCMNAFGRVWQINEAYSDRPGDISRAERLAVNYPVQGSASDLVTVTIDDIVEEQEARKMRTLFLGGVHDSILMDTYPGELIKTCYIMKYMAEVRQPEKYSWIKAPIRLDVGIGTAWGTVMDMKFKTLEEHEIVASTESNIKNVTMLIHTLRKAYEVDFEIVKSGIPKKEESFENFVNKGDPTVQEINLSIRDKKGTMIAMVA